VGQLSEPDSHYSDRERCMHQRKLTKTRTISSICDYWRRNWRDVTKSEGVRHCTTTNHCNA